MNPKTKLQVRNICPANRLQLVEENYAGVLCTKLWFPFEIRFTFPTSSAFPIVNLKMCIIYFSIVTLGFIFVLFEFAHIFVRILGEVTYWGCAPKFDLTNRLREELQNIIFFGTGFRSGQNRYRSMLYF